MKKLVKFNIQFPKYSLPAGEDIFSTPKDIGDARSITLEANTSVKNIYGNGLIVCSLVNDKGKTGSLIVNTIDPEYEIAMGRKVKTASGLAEIKQTTNKKHHIYFETCEIGEDSKTTVAKTWLYNCTSSRPTEAYNQTEDDINESTFEIPLSAITGVPLLNADDSIHTENGVEVIALSLTVVPGDPGYDTFGDAVVLPKLAEVTGG